MNDVVKPPRVVLPHKAECVQIYPDTGKVADIPAENGAQQSQGEFLRVSTSSSGVIEKINGVAVLPNPGHNRLLKISPTRVATPYSEANTAQYTALLQSDAVTDIDLDACDPGSGLPSLSLTCGAANNSTQEIRFDGLTAVNQGPDDVWLLPIKMPDDLPGVGTPTTQITLRISKLSAAAGSDYREYTITGVYLHAGWNVVVIKHTEILVGANEYGVVGTSINGSWSEPGATVASSPIQSMRLRVAFAAGQKINFGGIYRAPQGWCKAAIMWSADDVPHSFLDLAIPIIESFGWKTTLNAVSIYTDRRTGSHITLDEYRALIARGHEVWGHARLHEDMTAGTQAEKERAVGEAQKYWRANGIPTAAKYMSYPQLKYDGTALAILAAKGYRLARGGNGRFHQSWLPGMSPLCFGALSLETQNSWHADSAINGAILRGQAFFSYMHTTVAGGAALNTYPALYQHYADHLRRWCDLVAAHEQAGRAECMTYTGYFRAVGIDPAVDILL